MKSTVYSHHLIVQSEDIDELNHVNNIVYLKYIQDAAFGHWYTSVPSEVAEKMRWVARRHEIDYLKQALLGDALVVKTWVEAFTGVTSERHCEIRRGEELIAKSRTIWVSVDAVTFRPKRVGPEITEHFLMN